MPPLCPQATGTSFTLNPNLRARKQDFGIESPALDFLQRENRLDRGLLEGLESALRVLELKAESDAQQQIEDPAKDLAMQGLALSLGFGAQPARADGDVGAFLQSCEKASGLLRSETIGPRR